LSEVAVAAVTAIILTNTEATVPFIIKIAQESLKKAAMF
jgi:hypothetical protein